MSRSLRFVLIPLAMLLSGACSRRDAAEDGSPAARADSTDDMANMPGMGRDSASGDSATVTFTAGQIQHGGVRWAAAVPGQGATGLSAAATLPGQVAPNEDRTARLGAPAQGRIVSVRVSPGQRVRAGQVLVTLQSPEAGMAQSELAKATAALTSERAELAVRLERPATGPSDCWRSRPFRARTTSAPSPTTSWRRAELAPGRGGAPARAVHGAPPGSHRGAERGACAAGTARRRRAGADRGARDGRRGGRAARRS